MAIPPQITAISFFSGYAGIDLGLRRVIPTLRTICFVEREAFSVANLVAKIRQGLLDDAPIWSDIATFDYAGWRGMVDIAHGGVPCQPHSCAGKRAGGNDDRFLFDIWIDGLGIMQPKLIFIENVEGLLTSRMPDGTLCIRHVLRRLEGIRYCVEDDSGQPLIGIFSAAEVGAPHRRKRVFILAYRKDFRIGAWWKDNQFRGPGASSRDGEQLADSEHSTGSAECWAESRQRETTGPDNGPMFRKPGPSMADTTQRGQRELRESSGPNGQPDGSDSELGHAESDNQRRHTVPGIDGQRIEAGGSGGAMDNATGSRRDDAGQRSGADGEGGQCVSGQGCGELADAQNIGFQERRSQSDDLGEEQPAIDRSLPEFPPGPNDTEAWRQVPPELWPATSKLSVRSVADGPSADMVPADRYRIDALRAAGNGCVPATVAKAFVTLMNRIVKP